MTTKTPFLLSVFCCCVALHLFGPMHAHADAVYTITNLAGPDAIAAFDRNPETGLLTFKALYPTGGNGDPNAVRASQGALVAEGRFLYAVNSGSNTISVFRIHHDGSLKLIGSPVPSGGLNPVSIAISNRGILYVANRGDQKTVPANYTGFRIHQGRLRPMDGSTVELTTTGKPSDLIFSNNGRILIGARPADNTIDTFLVDDESGLLTRVEQLGGQSAAFAMEFNPAVPNQLVLLLAHLPGSATYNVARTGQIHIISSAVDPFGIDPCWLVVRDDGKVAWVAGFNENGISLDEIASDGTISFLNKHDTLSFGRFSTSLAADEDQRFMYLVIPGADIGSAATGVLHVMRITGNTVNGGLADLQTVSVPQSTNPIGLVVVSARDGDDDNRE
jgi:6-phosphogluconolactonase